MKELFVLNPWLEYAFYALSVAFFVVGLVSLLALVFVGKFLRYIAVTRKVVTVVTAVAATPGKGSKFKVLGGLAIAEMFTTFFSKRAKK